MNKMRDEFLAKLHDAKVVFKTQDPVDIALVTGVYDAMIHRFGDSDLVENLSDDEYSREWNKSYTSVMQTLDAVHLVSSKTFMTIWNAYDVITTEQVMSHA